MILLIIEVILDIDLIDCLIIVTSLKREILILTS